MRNLFWELANLRNVKVAEVTLYSWQQDWLSRRSNKVTNLFVIHVFISKGRQYEGWTHPVSIHEIVEWNSVETHDIISIIDLLFLLFSVFILSS